MSVSTVAGGSERGDRDGTARAALFMRPFGLTSDPTHARVLIADSSGNRVRALHPTTSVVRTVVGVGLVSEPRASLTGCRTTVLSGPRWMAVDTLAPDCFFVGDSARIARVDEKTDTVTTVVVLRDLVIDDPRPTGRFHFHYVVGLACDARGDLLFGDWYHHRIWRAARSTASDGIITFAVTTAVGNGGSLPTDGPLRSSALGWSRDLCMFPDVQHVVFAAVFNCIRKADFNAGPATHTTLALGRTDTAAVVG